MRKFVCAAVVAVCTVGIAYADEFAAIITKIDGDKVSFKKTKKGEEPGPEMTLPVKDINKSVFKGKAKKGVVETTGDALEKDAYTAAITKGIEGKAKGAAAYITTDADNKTITRIVLTGGKKKAKGGAE